MTHILLVIIFAVLMLPGLAGIVLPVPGLAYMFLVALIFGFVDKFSHLTATNLIILIILLVFSIISDSLAGIVGAKYSGASKNSLIAGTIGLIIGIFLFPPFGGIVGTFLGVLIWETLAKSTHKKAVKAASGSVIGSVVGMLISLFLSILFIFLFIIFALK